MADIVSFAARVRKPELSKLDRPFLPIGNPRLLPLLGLFEKQRRAITHFGHVVPLTEERLKDMGAEDDAIDALKALLSCYHLTLGMDVPGDWHAPPLRTRPPRRGG